MALADPQENLNQDLQQLYTLHVNELYKNLFLKHLMAIFNVGVICIVVAALLGTGIGLWQNYEYQALRERSEDRGLVSEHFKWRRLTGRLASNAVIVVEVTVKNGSKQSLHLDSIVPIDPGGSPLLAEVSYLRRKSKALRARNVDAVRANGRKLMSRLHQ